MSLSLNRDKGPVKAQTMPTKARAKPVAKKAARPAKVAPEALSARVLRLLDRMPAIPPGKNGDVEVKVSSIKACTPVDIVSMRNAILMGKPPLRVRFQNGININLLTYQGGTWMSTYPCELWQMDDAAQVLYGRVLFGGLGLGVAPMFASYSRRVKEMVIVEKDQRIVDLVWPHLQFPEHGTERCTDVACETFDLYDYLKMIGGDAFDSAFFDIWQGTGEYTWKEHVVPLRRLARGKIKHVHCWLEAEMFGQLYTPLSFSLAMPDDAGMPDY